MLKHVMLISFGIHGPELDSWACGKWPDIGAAETQAMVAMVGDYPPEMKELMAAKAGMEVRSRFQTNTKLVVIDDLHEGITTREGMEFYLKNISKEKLIEICKA